jgi:hypothetical protein
MNGKGNKPSHGVNWKKYYQNNPFPSKLDQKQDKTYLKPEDIENYKGSSDPMTFWGIATEEECKED